jgi:hypothetical protein
MEDPPFRDDKKRTLNEPKITEDPLRSGIRLLNDDLLDLYLKADADALKNQEDHRWTAAGAIFMGFFAILFAIIQFCLLSLAFELTRLCIKVELDGFVGFFRIMEVFAIISATAAVIAGLLWAHQNRWLINRHIAERCRLLKFRALLDKKFWNESEYDAWEKQVTDEISNLREIHDLETGKFSMHAIWHGFQVWIQSIFSHEYEEPGALEQWINKGAIPPSRVSGTCTSFPEAKTEFLNYYRKKRLLFQRDYYFCRHQNLQVKHHWIEKLPLLLFFASVCAVLLHFVVDIFAKESPQGQIASIALIGIAVTLPITGYVIKTYRDSFQVARSSALYYAKYTALENLNTLLSSYENSVDENWNLILDTLWECENFLEAEHREWLILILDAEWF